MKRYIAIGFALFALNKALIFAGFYAFDGMTGVGAQMLSLTLFVLCGALFSRSPANANSTTTDNDTIDAQVTPSRYSVHLKIDLSTYADALLRASGTYLHLVVISFTFTLFSLSTRLFIFYNTGNLTDIQSWLLVAWDQRWAIETVELLVAMMLGSVFARLVFSVPRRL